MNDPFGHAITDYFHTGREAFIQVNSNYTEDETIPASLFFRDKNQMPILETTALDLCRGKVLDVGAAAGCHSLILQNRGFDVTAIDKSVLSTEIMTKRGISRVICNDIFSFKGQRFDTILLLMNGAGIGQTLTGLASLLYHLKSLLNQNGQVILDSSDIHYLFEDDDGSVWIDLNNNQYYGEMEYEIRYKNLSDKFKWLFVDFNTLCSVCKENGLICKKVLDGKHHDYLAVIRETE